MGPLIPLFWTIGDVCSGFQSQGGSLACFLTCVIPTFTSGMTPADCIEVSKAARPFRSTYLQTCLQALVEVFARLGLKPMTIRANRRKHGVVNHSATPTRLDSHTFFWYEQHLLNSNTLIFRSYKINQCSIEHF